jgi:putative hydrolase
MSLSNRELAELLARASDQETEHRRRALQRASRAAMFWWPVEAADHLAGGSRLTDLPRVGPWTAHRIEEWLGDPPDVPDPPADREGFLTLAEATMAVESQPDLRPAVRGDLQVHTTHSDGSLPLPDMVRAAAGYGYEYVGITDHSKGLPIAGGMDEKELAAQGREIDELNAQLEAEGERIRVLRSIEMNLSPLGEGDMEPEALAQLDLVLGTFHSKLRVREDQTDRYLAAVANPTIDVLAHPRCRMYGRRRGLWADWRAVFESAAEHGVAVEVDGTAHRQDLDPGLLQIAAQTDVLVSMGTDAHVLHELDYMVFSVATVVLAGFPRERILNLWLREELLDWSRSKRR